MTTVFNILNEHNMDWGINATDLLEDYNVKQTNKNAMLAALAFI